MNDLRQELIQYLQSVIDKRVADSKPLAAVNLSGCLTPYKAFKDWLQNNFNCGSDLKQCLLRFVHQNSDHFTYDSNTGSIGINHYLKHPTGAHNPATNGFIKPKVLIDLEINYSLDTFDDNLRLLELIVFMFCKIRAKEVTISDMIESIEANCGKQFAAYKSRIGFVDKIEMSCEKNIDKLDLNYNNENVLLHLVSQLSPFFHFDLFQRTLAMSTPEDQIMDCLSTTGFALIRNHVSTLLYRFGSKSFIEVNDYLKQESQMVYDFLDKGSGELVTRMLALYRTQFTVQLDDNLELPLIDLQSEIVGEERSHEFKLLYKYGHKIMSLSGSVESVKHNYAIIECQTDLSVIDGQEFKPKFKVNADFVIIYGQQVDTLMAFLHRGDRLSFDATFITNIDGFKPKSNAIKDLWFVSRIYDINHSALCFVKPIFHSWHENSDEDNEKDNEFSDGQSSHDSF